MIKCPLHQRVHTRDLTLAISARYALHLTGDENSSAYADCLRCITHGLPLTMFKTIRKVLNPFFDRLALHVSFRSNVCLHFVLVIHRRFPNQVRSDENAFMAGVVFQFFGLLTVHVFRLCRGIHGKFTKAPDFDAALAIFRSELDVDATEHIGASVPLTPVAVSTDSADPNGKLEADAVVEELPKDTADPINSIAEYQCTTKTWEPVTHIRHRVRNITSFVNVGEDGLPRFRCVVYNTSQLDKGKHVLHDRAEHPFVIRVHLRERTLNIAYVLLVRRYL